MDITELGFALNGAAYVRWFGSEAGGYLYVWNGSHTVNIYKLYRRSDWTRPYAIKDVIEPADIMTIYGQDGRIPMGCEVLSHIESDTNERIGEDGYVNVDGQG